MFGIRYDSTGDIRPNNWSKDIINNKIEDFRTRVDFSRMFAVPKDYINNWYIEV